MLLTTEQLEAYRADGFLLVPPCFEAAEIAALKDEAGKEFAVDSERRVLERNSSVVRSVYGSHVLNEAFQQLVRDPRLLGPVMQVLGDRTYVYQFKVNAKAAFGGDLWEWHQDYVFWLNEDGVPEPNLVNVVVFLDEVTEFNGPMLMVRGSHREGVIDCRRLADKPEGYEESPSWIANLTADLKYSVGKEQLARLVDKYSLVSAKGLRGSVLLFHPNLVHGSGQNMSPFDRMISIVTYNRADNLPRPAAKRRPWFLVSEDHSPLVPLAGTVSLA
jgi:ectoine hydroxylase-related dioxygenase (phytanoyl-CoA dioxygenase family)